MGHRSVKSRVLADNLPDTSTIREVICNRALENAAFILFLDGRFCPYSGGQMLGEYDLCEHLSLDEQGLVTAYKAHHAGKSFVAVNGDRHRAWDWVDYPKVAADGQHVAYFALAESGPFDGGNRPFWLVVNDKPEEAYAQPGSIVFTNRGQLVFSVQVKNDSLVSLGNIRLGPFAAVSPPKLIARGNDVCFWAKTGERWCLYRNTHVIAESDRLFAGEEMTWSPDGNLIGYWVIRGGRWLVGLNGSLHPALGNPVPFVCGPVVASNGRFGYCAQLGNSVFAVVDGEKSEAYDAISKVSFSADGENSAYKGWKAGKESVVLNGKIVAEHDAAPQPIFNEAATIDDTPSVGANTIAYMRPKDQGQCVVWGAGKTSRVYNFISGIPTIADDMDTVVFGGFRDRNEYVVIANQEIGPYRRLWSAEEQHRYSIRWVPYIRADSKEVAYAAREGGRLLLCTVPL